MITQVSEHDFIDAFRAIRPDNFSYSGLKALYAYFENLSNDIGYDFDGLVDQNWQLHNIEFDVIGICCDFVEYKNWAEFIDEYGSVPGKGFSFELREPCCDTCKPYWTEKRLENLSEHTIVIPISEEYTSMDIDGIMSSNKDGFIIQAF